MQVIAIEFTEHPKYGKKLSLPVEKKTEIWPVFIILRSTVLQCLSLGTVSIPAGHFFYLELYCFYYSFNECNYDLKCFLKSQKWV